MLGDGREDTLVCICLAQQIWAARAALGPGHCQLSSALAVVAGHTGGRLRVGMVVVTEGAVPKPQIVCNTHIPYISGLIW